MVVFGPAVLRIAAFVPTAVNRPPEIATASAIENRASTVMTWPLTRIVSGGSLLETGESQHAGENSN